MLNTNVPVVIIHRKYADYVKTNLEITGHKNKIYLIGDDSVSQLRDINNVTFVNIDKYENIPYIKDKFQHFINYSSNNKIFEWRCFERIFILKYFMEEYKLNQVFHIDSDNILLDNINTYSFEKNIAYCVNTNFHTYRMSNSIHCGLLNQEFCDKFTELYDDIFINTSKFHLIKDKIDFHRNIDGKFTEGGICDMTLYYLLVHEKILDVHNLLVPKNDTVFMNHINSGEGKDSKTQYKLNTNKMLDINITNDGKCFIYDIINDKRVMLLNIHFQGPSKIMLNSHLKSLFIK